MGTALLPSGPGVLRPRSNQLELVHRLDKETSGCLLVAKRRAMLRALHDLLRRNQVRKRYLALVRGAWTGGRLTVNDALVKNRLASGERVVRADASGKAAVTEMLPISRTETASLVEARPVTGRTHQIRVHAASIGAPIAGDTKYGERGFNQRLRALGLRRLFLHAHRLEFDDPRDGLPVVYRAPLADDLAKVLRTLELQTPKP